MLPEWLHAQLSCLPAVPGRLRAAACWTGPCTAAVAVVLSSACTHARRRDRSGWDPKAADDAEVIRNQTVWCAA